MSFTRTVVRSTISDIDEAVTLLWKMQNAGGLCIQISGAFTGTCAFEMSVDEINFYPLSLRKVNDPTIVVTESAAPGVWWGRIYAAALIRVRGLEDWNSEGDPATVTLYGQPS